DVMSRLRDADLGGSRLVQTMDPTMAAKLASTATRRGLQNWSTVLLLDRLWAERIPLRGDADAP
ncbi:MAG: hypothetical protein QOD78_1502, partial [Chloroflexota bacterium]|nr:hypothetical protein [Chloroflexota bacterium]